MLNRKNKFFREYGAFGSEVFSVLWATQDQAERSGEASTADCPVLPNVTTYEWSKHRDLVSRLDLFVSLLHTTSYITSSRAIRAGGECVLAVHTTMVMIERASTGISALDAILGRLPAAAAMVAEV